MFGTATFAGFTFGGPTVAEFTYINVPDKPNFLQVRTSAGVLLHRLDAWFDAEVDLKVNEPGRVSFSIPLGHPAVQDNSLVAPNEIWWFDSSHLLRRKFIIQEEEITLDGGQQTYKVYGEDYLVRLAYETNDVTGSASPMTVSAAISLIVAAQINANPVTKGYIDPVIGATSISFPNQTGTTFLAMLNDLRKQNVGGYFGVNSSNALCWYDYPAYSDLVLNMQNNLSGYSEKRKSSSIYNRVYVYGSMQSTGSRITCSAPGYKESSASQSTYGVRTKVVRNSRIKTQAACDAVAQMIVNTFANPPIVRTFPVIDTQALKRGTMLTDAEVNETIHLGRAVKVRVPATAPSSPFVADVVTMQVLGVKRNLSEFAQIEVTLGGEFDDLILKDDNFIDTLADSAIANESQNEQDTQDLFDLTPQLHTDLNDCPSSLGTAGQIVKINTGATAHDYTTGGAAGSVLQRNSANTAPEWLGIGTGNQVIKSNNGATQVEYTTGGSALQVLRRNSGNNNLEWASVQAPVTISSTLSGLGTSTDAAFGEVTADGNNEGVYYFPDGGTVNADWRMMCPLIQATTKSNLGNPGRFSFGWVSTAGAEFGLWYYPPNGTANSDWLPVNLYSTAV